MQVRPADPARRDVEQQLARSRRGIRPIDEREGPARRLEHHRLHAGHPRMTNRNRGQAALLMRAMRMRTHLLVGVLALSLLIPAAAQARTHVRVSIADQHISMFDAPAYQRLKLKRTRYFIRWDAIRHPADLAAVKAYVRRARRAHVRVLVHVSTNDLRERKAKLPSVRQYRRDVGRLVHRLRPLGVREWGAWNEVNHKTQPTWKSPRRAAQFFKTMRRLCKGCRVVALDALDQAGVTRYIRRFYRALGRYRRFARIRPPAAPSPPARRGAPPAPPPAAPPPPPPPPPPRPAAPRAHPPTPPPPPAGRAATPSPRAPRRGATRNYQCWLTESGGVVN